MKIGIDAKWYFSGPPSTKTMLQNLLPRLFALYPEHEWIVFLDKKDKETDFPYKASNITVQYVWAGINMISNLFILPRYIRKHSPEVTIFQTFPAFYTRTIPVIFIHDILFKDYPQYFTWKERLYFLPIKWWLNKARRLIVTTVFVKNSLLKHHYYRSKGNIDIIPLGVARNFTTLDKIDYQLLQKVKEKFRLPKTYVLFVGRLNARKNITVLLKAIPFFTDKNISVVIAGKEDGKSAKLDGVLSDSKLKDRIILLSNVSDEELPAIYAMSKLFCFPSFAEGFGLPPIEAMAAGIPVVVSAVTSLPEVCNDAVVYIDPERPESIAKAVNELLENNIFYSQKKEEGLKRAKKYTWDTTAELIMQTINKSVEK